MKALVLCITLTILSSLSLSAVVLSDDFSDNSMGNSWTLYETNHASCWVSETNQRLEFRATGSPTSEQVAGYISNNWKLSPNSNFQMRMSYYYSKNTANDGGLNITISPSTGNYFQVGAGCDENAPYMGYKIVGSMATEQGIARGTNSGTVYLSYDSPSDTLYVSTTGYGSGNALTQIPGLVKGSWGGVNLSVGLFGYSSGVALASGEAYADNFILDTGTLVYTQYSLNLTKTGDGSIKVDNVSHSLPWSGTIAAGSTVTLEAVPASGWEFTSWSGDKTGSTNPTTITINGNKNVLVTFTQTAAYGGGSGTAGDPYQIRTPQQMNAIGANSADWSKHFKLMADIDMSAYTGTQYNIIGNSWDNYFSGTFDGNGHVIRNLTYTAPAAIQYIGLFGYTIFATIQNLGVENVTLSTGATWVGGLVGLNQSSTLISCYVTGSVTGGNYVGGLVGTNYGGAITGCYTTGLVSGNQCVGGLVGGNEAGSLTVCYSTSSVSGNQPVGGLVGLNYDSITACYAAGSVSGTEPSSVHGLVGVNMSGSISASFWDTQTSGQAASPWGTGKTTAQMQTQSTFTSAGWDFIGETVNGTNDYWRMPSMGGYPVLNWQEEEISDLFGQDFPDFNGDGKTDILWRNVNTGVYLFTLMDGLTLGLTKSLGGSSATLQIAGLADFNADGKTDIVWRDVNTGAYRGAIMDGNTLVQIKGLGGSSTTLQIVGLVDFNNDDKTDFVWRNVNTGAYLGTLMEGLTMVQTKGLGGSSTTLQIADLADFNADGMDDIVWRNVNTGAFLGTQMNGLTLVQTKNFGGSSTTLQIVDLADFNNDDKADLVWRNVNTGAYIATQMNGLTMVQNKGLGGSAATLQIADLADFNADGMADILWRNVNTGAFLGTQMNGLTLVQTKNFGGSSTTLQVVGLADFNADAKADLVWRNVNTGSYLGTQMNGLTMVQNKGLGGSTTTLQIP